MSYLTVALPQLVLFQLYLVRFKYEAWVTLTGIGSSHFTAFQMQDMSPLKAEPVVFVCRPGG